MTREADEATGREGVNEPPGGRRRGAWLQIDVDRDDADWSAFGDTRSAIEAVAAALVAHPGVMRVRSNVAVALSSDAESGKLNTKYRMKLGPTNVLSFPAPPLPKTAYVIGPRLLGDILIARETVLREARAMDIPPVHHLQHLIVHGVLHLVGHDHQTDAEAERMEALETEILARLGVANPYDEPAPGANAATAKR